MATARVTQAAEGISRKLNEAGKAAKKQGLTGRTFIRDESGLSQPEMQEVMDIVFKKYRGFNTQVQLAPDYVASIVFA